MSVGVNGQKNGRSFEHNIVFVYGFLMVICYAVSMIAYTVYLHDSNFVISWDNFDKYVLILAGFVIMFYRRKSILSAVGISAMAIALGKLPKVFNYMTSSTTLFSNLSGTVMFCIGVVTLVLAVNLFYTGVMYQVGLCRGYFWHMVSISILAGLDAFIAAIAMLNFIRVEDFMRAAQLALVYVPGIMVYIVYVYLLNRDEVRESLQTEKMHTKLSSAITSIVPERDAAITREDAARILDGPVTWSREGTVGPVESELRIKISHSDSDTECIIQKWKDDDRIFFTICNTCEGTFLEASRFSAVKISPDSGDIRDCSSILFIDREQNERAIAVFDPEVTQ